MWRAVNEDGLGVVIKMLRKDSPEVSILRKMLSLPSPRNKIIPGYFVDFGSARMLPAGPDSGIVVDDWKKRPSGKVPPPEGTDAVDPYGYDVYMLNYTIMTWSPVSASFVFYS